MKIKEHANIIILVYIDIIENENICIHELNTY